jgi:hypothetical protein
MALREQRLKQQEQIEVGAAKIDFFHRLQE